MRPERDVEIASARTITAQETATQASREPNASNISATFAATLALGRRSASHAPTNPSERGTAITSHAAK